MSSDRRVKTRCRPIETHGSDQIVGASVASNVTASDGWTRRADVVCVGATCVSAPQSILRSDEDGRTHRSAPTNRYTFLISNL